MIKALYIFAVLIFCAGLLYQFAALKVFNFIVPKDSSSELIASGVAYAEDPQQRLDIYRPKDAGLKLPILLFVHGGSWKDGNRSDYEFAGRAFAARGYLTLVMSYRLLPKNRYPDFISDVALALTWAQNNAAEFGGDGRKIFAVGHSAGAYNISLAVLDQRYLTAADFDQQSLLGVASLAGPFDFLPLDSPITRATFGGVADLPSTQPINFARKDAPPFLLLHGTADTTVYPKNSRSLSKHLTEAGAKAELIEYSGVSHVGIMLAVAKPLRGNAPVLDDVDRFFKDILK